MYSDEKNVQLTLALLKKKGIRKLVASPGSTNAPFVRSAQQDSYFQMYSAVDERSAAYMACGLSEEAGEPVVISCTGATASRNYMPALTEAYYRKLPIIAVATMNDPADIGNLTSQVIDRTEGPRDICLASLRVDRIETRKQFDESWLSLNRVLGELNRNGGGPVRIELITTMAGAFSTSELPDVPLIKRFTVSAYGSWPDIPKDSRVLVSLGSIGPRDAASIAALEAFARSNDAVVLTNVAAGSRSARDVYSALTCAQLIENPMGKELSPDLVIQIGEVSGDYDTFTYLRSLDVPVWRVSPDGEMRKTFRRLDAVFQCEPGEFFAHYSTHAETAGAYYEAWKGYDSQLRESCPDLPFSNIWIASQLAPAAPAGSTLHGSILSSMAALNYFPPASNVRTAATVGGFGIDGCMSSLVGASLADPSKLYIGLIGDLSFFYDMNVLGNRHVGPNVRIVLVNNNLGMTFKHANHYAHTFGPEADEFIAAGGHFVNRFGSGGPSPARAWAESLGFTYLPAHNAGEFQGHLGQFMDTSAPSPILLECFVTESDEYASREIVTSIDKRRTSKAVAKSAVKGIFGDKGVATVKKILGR